MTDERELTPDVALIAEHLASSARAYGNYLKWNEQAMFKADLMNVRQRWRSVPPAVFAAKLKDEGMRDEDVVELNDWLTRAQSGRRLIPHRTYRNFRFAPPTHDDPAPYTDPAW